MRIITSWEVHLTGAPDVLDAMAQVYTGPDPLVSRVGKDYFLSSPRFLRITDSLEVINAAAQLVRRLCGLLNLFGNYIGRVWPDGAEWIDNGGRRGGAGRIADLYGNMVSKEQLAHLSGGVGTGETRATRLQRAAETDSYSGAMLDLAGCEALSFGTLYMLYELLRAEAGGIDKLAARTGVPKARLKLFAQTANTFRHPDPLIAKPRIPMPYHEAVALIRGMVRNRLNTQL